ncbi:tumor necrosis factor receptor superfamily member 4 [Fukomys damarensis]|uniref:tumor necrosis factor receptor superfamily member 4 n=1 Tax=Fukomys damarensis TaxID=885580 RepID=UPI000540126A|nr:tumor necrosis factor receptor superfamily member 4 [Fukomys damarensis]
MCVGACALLLLGLVHGATAGLNCVGDTYFNGHLCCHDCQPGNMMVSRCRGTTDSVCLPCKPGFYNEAVNYQFCKPCTHCNQRSGSEIKQNCTATQDTVCHCRPGTQPLDGFKHGVDCKPCLPGHFSLGSNQACKPWTKCASAGKQTLKQGSSSSDAICEDRSPLATLSWETQGPTARSTKARPTMSSLTMAQPTVARPTASWAWTSQGPFMPPLEAPSDEGLPRRRGGRGERTESFLLSSWTYSASWPFLAGPVLAAVLGLGLGLGLLVPMAVLLVLYLYRRAWMPPGAPKPSGGKSFRKPIQEEQANAHSALAKI